MSFCKRKPPRLGGHLISQRQAIALVIFCSVFLVFFAAMLRQFNPAQYAVYPGCPLHETTGLLCPGCGGLRSVHHLANGRISTAFLFNPAFVLSLPLWLYIFTAWGREWWSTRRIPLLLHHRHSYILLIAITGLFLFQAVIRNLPWEPFLQLGLPGLQNP